VSALGPLQNPIGLMPMDPLMAVGWNMRQHEVDELRAKFERLHAALLLHHDRLDLSLTDVCELCELAGGQTAPHV
jgi:hypothetical protein